MTAGGRWVSIYIANRTKYGTKPMGKWSAGLFFVVVAAVLIGLVLLLIYY